MPSCLPSLPPSLLCLPLFSASLSSLPSLSSSCLPSFLSFLCSILAFSPLSRHYSFTCLPLILSRFLFFSPPSACSLFSSIYPYALHPPPSPISLPPSIHLSLHPPSLPPSSPSLPVDHQCDIFIQG